MAQILPYSAILCHFRTFCKENLYLTRQPLCFHHFARDRPLTSRHAALPSIMQVKPSRARQQAVAVAPESS